MRGVRPRKEFDRSPVRLPAFAALCAAALVLAATPAGAVQVNRVSVCETGSNDCDAADVRLQNVLEVFPDFGLSVAMGHLNGDAFADLVVGAPGSAQVYVFLGTEQGPLAEAASDRSLAADTADAILEGSLDSDFGFSVAVAEGPGPQPLIIGAPATGDPAQAGAAFVLPAGSLAGLPSGVPTLIDNVPGRITMSGLAPGDQTGYAVALGPVLFVGNNDYVVSARNAQGGAGVVYAVTETLNPTADLNLAIQLTGSTANEGAGEFLAVADFVSGGTHEVAIGAVGIEPDDDLNPAGRVYIAQVAANTTLPFGAYCVVGDSLNDFFGFSLAAGDFEGGAAADLAVGAIYADRPGAGADGRNTGAVYLFTNVPGLSDDACASVAAAAADRVIYGFRKWDLLGSAMDGGNLNPAPVGKDDLVVAARWSDRDQTSAAEVDEGAAYVIFGGKGFAAWPANMDCPDPDCDLGNPVGVDALIAGGVFESPESDEMGFSLAVGDFNGPSAIDDLAVASLTHDRVYLVALNDEDDDGFRDIRDTDDDNDGVADAADLALLDPDVCADADADTCDDCSVGTDDLGPLADNTPNNDGTDTDTDGACDLGDTDDDNDGVDDGDDTAPLNPDVCEDADSDTCDDCSVGTDDLGPLADNTPDNDGTDTDTDGACDLGDTDDDNDGVLDVDDTSTLNPDVCEDADSDGCDDCSVGTDDLGPLADNDTANDGVDTDTDTVCDVGDDCTDADGDGLGNGNLANAGCVNPTVDSDDANPNACADTDADTCDDCTNGSFDPANDGLDTDSDGDCDAGDNDLDGDGVANGPDQQPFNPFVCLDTDSDGCDDCSTGTFDPANDGADGDSDGQCDATDDCTDADADGLGNGNLANAGCINPTTDSNDADPNVCADTDSDTCDDCDGGSFDPANDGPDADSDGACDAGDLCSDADSDGLGDGSGGNAACVNPTTDSDDADPNVCADTDGDGCDDCVGGSFNPAADGTDTDSDGLCDVGDDCTDADSDGLGNGNLGNAGCVNPATDSNDADPNVCGDTDGDTCEDCVGGSFNPAADGTDTDSDGQCDLTDDCTDADADGLGNGNLGNASCVDATTDSNDADPNACADTDADGCDDCSGGSFDPASDGPDGDSDGQCDTTDDCTDADSDGLGNGNLANAGCVNATTDSNDVDPNVCADTDVDLCDDCTSGAFDPTLDGPDADTDGLCDLGDPDIDGDGVFDDGDSSGTPGDAPCTGGATVGCDDNCPLTPNPAQLDGDSDGIGDDCDPSPPPAGGEPLIEAMAGGTVSWSSVAGAASYHLYRSDLQALRDTGEYTQAPDGASGSEQFCSRLQTEQADGETPLPGQVFLYLVTSDDGTSEGTLGRRSDGQNRPNDNPCQ